MDCSSNSSEDSQNSTDTAESDSEEGIASDDKSDEDVDSVVRQVGMDATMTKDIMQALTKKLRCEMCSNLIKATDVVAFNFVNYRLDSDILNNPSVDFNAAVVAAIRFVDNKLSVMGHELNLSSKLRTLLQNK